MAPANHSSPSGSRSVAKTRGWPSGASISSGGVSRVEQYARNTEEALTRRASLIAEKQAVLDKILHDHDSLIRELFHLEKFVTLLGFDPKVAKEDNSAVFQQYKAGYDLLNKFSEPSNLSYRTTRRTHTQRIMNIKGSDVVSPIQDKNVVPVPVPSVSSVSKGKERALGGDRVPIEFSTGRRNSSKAQGKIYVDQTPSGAKAHAGRSTISGSLSAAGISEPRKRHIDDTFAPLSSSPIPVSKKRRVTESFSGLSGKNQTYVTPTGNRVSRYMSHSKTEHSLAGIHDRSLDSSQSVQKPVTPKSSIKRIKLIVRPPPPAISHHLQCAPAKKFESLGAFLSSYVSLDGRDVQAHELQEMAKKQSNFLNHINSLRREGRVIFDATSFEGIVGSNSVDVTEPERSGDHWDKVVETVVSRPRNGRSGGRQIAQQIAHKVQYYWDHHGAKEDKARAQEEKRLRALAKATIKMVTNEWKKAVFYIRDQERKRAEREEMIRGHEHLDAILDQSGQILETQQSELAKGDFSRSRSRSSSVSTTLRDWASDAYGWEGEESESEGSDKEEAMTPVHSQESIPDHEGEPSSSDENEDEEASVFALLGNYTPYRLQDNPDEDKDLEVPSQQSDQDVDMHQDTPQAMEADSKDSNSPSMLFDVQSPPDQDVLPTAESNQANAPHSTSISAPGSPNSSASHDICLEKQVDDPSISEADLATQDENAAHVHNDAIIDDPIGIVPPATIQVEESQEKSQTLNSDNEAIIYNDSDDEGEGEEESIIVPEYLKPYAVSPVEWTADDKVKAPVLLRGVLRPYQQSGLEWLASLHSNNLNGILADEMGLGKTIQTISLLAHLACDRGIWGPHLIIVPTSVLLNWEMEFKKFLPGFKILSYHGTTKRRKELRQGWYNKHHFNVCITSYTLASRDAHIFKRKAWYYMILDEAHMIKNFKSQRWNILLMFRSFRRLLLTGTPLQNNLTELWALLQFLMSGTNFANLKEFGDWFSNPLEKAIEMGTVLDDENMQRVSKLHTVLRPYLLRRLKRDVEKELPSKFEHLVLCHLSKRQRFLYDEFMSRAHTRDALHSGVYQKIANILMQLRKVCNHPDLFEVRPIVTSFSMGRSAIADFEIKELLVRRQMFEEDDGQSVDLDLLGLRFTANEHMSILSAIETRRLDATSRLPSISELPGEPPPKDNRTIQGFRAYQTYQQHAQRIARWTHIGYLNRLRCSHLPVISREMLATVRTCYRPLLPLSALDLTRKYLDTTTLPNTGVKSYSTRAEELRSVIDNFAFVTPPVVALDLPRIALSGYESQIESTSRDVEFDAVLHQATVKLQIAFPNPSLLQYDCGKMQELARLLREKKAGGHRVLIFTQMTRILDILEVFLNFHGYLYLRLDGATKIEDRQYITERFNVDERVFCFIASSRSGGVGINLTGADTVIFYDSDFNPQMDRQCEDRAHRIGQIRDVHIYRFISSHTVEEAMLLKANQKRSLDDLVIQKGEFDWRSIFEEDGALRKALGEFEDTEDAHAAAVAAREAVALEGADQADFEAEGDPDAAVPEEEVVSEIQPSGGDFVEVLDTNEPDNGGAEEEGGTIDDYMVTFVRFDYEFFRDWRL